MDNKDEFYLKIVVFSHFFDYLALGLNYTNDYKFSDYYKLFELINKDENIKKFNNIINNYDLLDFVNDIYNNNINIKLFYDTQKLLVNISDGEKYYIFGIDIRHKIFKNYKNMQHFVSELEDYIDFTFNNKN
jgi:hypothetical protein